MDSWERFERDLAEELGLKRVAGSGNTPWSKLDVQGKDTRWSLKYTENGGLSLSRSTLAEAILATGGMGGGGEMPVWASRIDGVGDFVTMRFEDWKSFFLESPDFSIKPNKAESRKALASVPQLARED